MFISTSTHWSVTTFPRTVFSKFDTKNDTKTSGNFLVDSEELKCSTIEFDQNTESLIWDVTMAIATGSIESDYQDASGKESVKLTEQEKLALALSCFGAWKDREDINDNWLDDLRTGWNERLNDIYGETEDNSL